MLLFLYDLTIQIISVANLIKRFDINKLMYQFISWTCDNFNVFAFVTSSSLYFSKTYHVDIHEQYYRIHTILLNSNYNSV